MKKKYIKPTFTVIELRTGNLLVCSICGGNGNHYGHHKTQALEEDGYWEEDFWDK